MTGFAAIRFAPLLPYVAIIALGVLVFAPLAFAAFRKARGTFLRAGFALLLLLALCGPELVKEQRTPQNDIVLVVSDASPSMGFDDRRKQAEGALASIKSQAAAIPGLEVREIAAGAAHGTSLPPEETRLMDAAASALADLPRGRMAGVVLITDGQVHDAPKDAAALGDIGPVHVLLAGGKDETDRRIALTGAPAYGMVGQDVEVGFSVSDTPKGPGIAAVRVLRDGELLKSLSLDTGREHRVFVPLIHAGRTLVTLECDGLPGEITTANNRTAFAVSGIRDRLKVLMVSGAPNPGERAWRNLLKSDPSVDLVHFTILRPPERPDPTPESELSLIQFPVQELFLEKTKDFDLIILDQYRPMSVMLPPYLANMADYVRGGGALMIDAGPDFAMPETLAETPLGPVLPGMPSGAPVAGPFVPRLTGLGARHPVTEGLDSGAPWGRWMRYLPVTPKNADILMEGGEGNAPLLLLARQEKGRVALLASDQIWLWARQYDGGGPHDELLRRLVHWLMKEPELEENDLRLSLAGNMLKLDMRSMEDGARQVEITSPSGKAQTVELAAEGGDGWASATLPADELGVWLAKEKGADGDARKSFVLVGSPAAPEMADVVSTDTRLAPLVAATGGGFVRLAGHPAPALRMMARARNYAGSGGQLGLRRNNAFAVSGISTAPLLPAWLLLALMLAAIASAWRKESR